MKRTENMKFPNLLDFDYDSDYSEGETSEDMKIQSSSVSRYSSGRFSIPQPGFRLPIDEQLNRIDQTFDGSNKSSFLPLIPLKLEFSLVDEAVSKVDDETVECIILNVAKPSMFNLPNSEYVGKKTPIVSWSEALHSLEPKNIHRYYKKVYMNIRNQIRFTSYIPPTFDQFSTLSSLRHDVPNGRIVFQYIGFGFHPPSNGNIYALHQKSYSEKPFPLKEIFKNLRPPTLYIFDCNNAAEALPIFKKVAEEKEKSNAGPTIPNANHFMKSTNWSDYFCLCATDVGEELPADPRLPRDLLSSIIASPVTTALLIHILQYYRTSFTDPDFPFSHLKSVLAFETEESENLSTILAATIDSIACETLSPKMFTTLFRKDKTTRVIFMNFILAKFLLSFYGVHPQSHPQLPEMSKHLLWRHWKTTADMWITSRLTPRPQIITNFFTNAIDTLESHLKLKRPKDVSMGLLATVCYAPFTHKVCSKAYFLLAEYASYGDEFVENLKIPFLFNQSAEYLCDYGADLHPIAYIILTLINSNPRLIDDISPTLDIKKLSLAICDKSIDQETRALITAFLAITVDKVRSVKQYVSSKAFIEDISEIIKSSNPLFLIWSLMLIVSAFQNEPIDMTSINNNSLHLQIACGIRHKTSEVRTASILALAALLQPIESTINGVLLMHAALAISDTAVHTRMALFLFVMKYISLESDTIATHYSAEKIEKSFQSISDLLAYFIPYNKKGRQSPYFGFGDFENYARSISEGQNDDSFVKFASNLALYLLNHFLHDTYQPIVENANKAKSFLKSIINSGQTLMPTMKLNSMLEENFEKFQSQETFGSFENAEGIGSFGSFGQFGSFEMSGAINKAESPSSFRDLERTKSKEVFTNLEKSDSTESFENSENHEVEQSNIDDEITEFGRMIEKGPTVFKRAFITQIAKMGLYAPSVYTGSHNAPMQHREYGTFDLKTAHLQLRAQTKLKSKPVCACNITGMLGIAVATEDGHFILFDDDFVDGYEYKLGSVCSCDSVKVNELPLIITVDTFGGAALINSLSKEIYTSFSTEINCTTPQKRFVRSRNSIIYFCSESGNVTRFDIVAGLCTGEWNFATNGTKVSAFGIHPTNENILIIGYENGGVKEFNVATGQMNQRVITLDHSIVSINEKDKDFVYISSSNGLVLVLNTNTGIMDTCPTHYKKEFLQFTCHKKLPFFMVSPANDVPVILHENMSVSHTLENPIQKSSIIVLSDEYPVFCLLNESGDILSYNLIQ